MNIDEPPGEPYFDDAEHTPRVNLSYANETQQADPRSRPSFLSKIGAVFSFAGRNFVPTVKAGVAALIIFAYPAMVVFGHQLDDSAVELGDERHWSVPEIGVTSTLLARELDGPGWLSDKHQWHPQSRLTALPAWQDGLLTTLADHGRLMLNILAEDRDQDLITGVRLLDTSDETHKVTDRLLAAMEAFARYDDRVAGGVTRAPMGAEALIARLDTGADWAAREYAKLAEISDPGDGWLASEDAITRFYSAKAVAHVTYTTLASVAAAETSLLDKHGATDKMQDTLRKWRSAAQMRPLFVSNQGGNSLTAANHPAIMALHIDQARRAMLDLAQHLEASLQAQATPTPDTPVIDVASNASSESN